MIIVSVHYPKKIYLKELLDVMTDVSIDYLKLNGDISNLNLHFFFLS